MKSFTSIVIVSAVASPALLFACDLATATPDAVNQVAAAAAGCPDLTSASAVAKIDFASEFKLAAQVGAQIKSGVAAALELKAFAAKLDADLKAACGGLATDLGASGDWSTGADACKAAATAMADIKSKLGGGFSVELIAEPPHCAVALDAMADCLAQCDASLEPGKVDLDCESGKLAGTCEAECSGSCELEAAATCDGTCHGTCEAKFNGSCGGECTGRCDGKKVEGAACEGTCKGSCSAMAEGQCGGQCSGTCEFDGAASCEGTCRGECSVEMKAPRCEGEIEPPKASVECKASCQAKLQAQVECTPGQVALRINGASDVELAMKYKAAIEKHLPAVLNIAVGMKDQALAVAGNVEAVVKGAQSAVGELKSDAEVGARLAACVAAPFKAAFDAAASVKASVDVSVEVQASASASASASGSASAG